MREDDERDIIVNDMRFSRDRETIILSTSKAMSIISTRSLNTLCSIRRPTDLGDLLSRSSLCATVNAKYSAIQLWTVSQPEVPRTIGSEISLVTHGLPILNIMFNPKRLLVLTADSLFILQIPTLKLLQVVERGSLDIHKNLVCLALLTGTCCHDNGLCAMIIEKGDVLVMDTFTLNRYQVFTAHTSPVSALEFSMDGRLLATASTKGTLVRVFKTEQSRCLDLVCILRRGRSENPITSLLFDSSSQTVTVSGNTDTCHVFTVPDCLSTKTVIGTAYQSLLSILPKQYKEAVEAVRDYAHVKLRRNNPTDFFFACLTDPTSVLVVSVVSESSAFAFGYTIDKNGGECKLRSEHAFTNFPEISSTVVTPTTVYEEQDSTQRPVEVVLKDSPQVTTLEETLLTGLPEAAVITKKPKKRKPKKKLSEEESREIFDGSE
jgi:autophagy-related protein 18